MAHIRIAINAQTISRQLNSLQWGDSCQTAPRVSIIFQSYFFAVIAQRIQALQAQGIDVISLDIGSPVFAALL